MQSRPTPASLSLAPKPSGHPLRRLAQMGALIAGLSLAGCATEADGPILQVAGPVPVGDVHQWYPRAAEDRVTYFEVAEPTILDVAERRVGNTLYQRTVYANNTAVAGENYLQVTLLFDEPGLLSAAPPPGSIYRTTLAFEPEELEAKLAREFPDTAAVTPGDAPTNVYGFYNYAVARYGSDVTCTYIYQIIGDRSRILPSDYLGILIEMRLCRAAAPGEQGALALHLDLYEDLRFSDKTGILPKNALFEGQQPPSVFEYNPDRSARGVPMSREWGVRGPRVGGFGQPEVGRPIITETY